MNDEQRQVLNAASITPLHGKRYTRRQTVAMLGGLGIVAAVHPPMAGVAVAQEVPPASPVATPVLGPRDDGTNLWKVQVGGMDMENGIDLHAFFPEEITINADDAVHFAFAPMGVPGFHTVTFLSGEELPPLLTPNVVDGTPVASPEGPPQLILNPLVAWTDGRTDYDGTGYANSGLDVFRLEDGPYILTFTTPGTFEYECAVHGIVMKGTVVVQEAGATLPNDLAAYDAMAAGQIAAIIEEGMAAVAELEAENATPASGGTTTWAVSAGAGGESQARVMRFLPAELTIKAGDTVRWNSGSVGEPHTVTFLGGEEQPEDTLVEPQASGPPKFIQNMQTFLPAGGSDFDGAGYHSSGFMGFPPEVADLFGLSDSYELTFTAAGEYSYYCILHSGGPEAEEGMNGTIIVEA